MKSIKPILWLSAWLIILPFLGIPGSWKALLTMGTGVALLIVAFLKWELQVRVSRTKGQDSIDGLSLRDPATNPHVRS